MPLEFLSQAHVLQLQNWFSCRGVKTIANRSTASSPALWHSFPLTSWKCLLFFWSILKHQICILHLKRKKKQHNIDWAAVVCMHRKRWIFEIKRWIFEINHFLLAVSRLCYERKLSAHRICHNTSMPHQDTAPSDATQEAHAVYVWFIQVKKGSADNSWWNFEEQLTSLLVCNLFYFHMHFTQVCMQCFMFAIYKSGETV